MKLFRHAFIMLFVLLQAPCIQAPPYEGPPAIHIGEIRTISANQS